MNDPASMPSAHRFAHEAMNTTFHLHILAESVAIANGMARECFEQLDYLESRLSRFIDGSDISRINRLDAGETLYISQPCHECLLIALDAYARTGGLFDITLGRRIEHRKSGDPGPSPALTGTLVIHPDVPAVTCEEPGREIDLGGIGKGFALDYLQRILIDWGAEGAFLTAGASSMLAFGPRSWPVDLSGDGELVRIALHDQALSASGTTIQGSHIIHPDESEVADGSGFERLWVISPTAAVAETWSTALMLVELNEIRDLIVGEASIQSVHAYRKGSFINF